MADSTCYLLEQWGRWAWTARGLHLKYPGIIPFRRLNKITSAPTPAISDVVACEVDRAVAELSVHDPKAGNAVVGFYLFGQPEYKLATRLHCRREKVEGLLRRGIAFVSDRLDGE